MGGKSVLRCSTGKDEAGERLHRLSSSEAVKVADNTQACAVFIQLAKQDVPSRINDPAPSSS